MADAIIELSFVSNTLAWLDGGANQFFEIVVGDSTDILYGRPPLEYSSLAYISLAAALVAFSLIGLGGILCFILQSGLDLSRRPWTRVFYALWIILLTPSTVLTLAALTFTWSVNDNNGSVDSISTIHSDGPWTIENWLNAVIQQEFIHDSDRHDIHRQLAIAKGWRINLVPLFILGVAASVFGRWDFVQRNRASKKRNDRDDAMNQANESGHETQSIVRYELPG